MAVAATTPNPAVTPPPNLDPITGLPKPASPWIGTQPQVDDTVANQVTALAGKDSALNQMARTEGLKVAQRRGLLNSSFAVGEAQDAVLKNVLPIAQQDAGQAFQKNMAARNFEYGMTSQVQQQGWQTSENIAQRGFLGTQADLDRDLQQTLQTQQINSQQLMQIKQIASTEGIEKANRALQAHLQENDIQFRMSEGKLDRAAAVAAQKADILFRQTEGKLDRSLQQQIASWNLASNDRNAAAQFLTNMETMYQNQYQSIMSNTSLDAASRTKFLTAAKNLRNNQINFVEQMYNIDLKWPA